MLAALLAALVAVAAATAIPSPPFGAPQPFGSPCIGDAEVDAHIDPRLPGWMRSEIREVMLKLPPQARCGPVVKVSGVDREGRYIFNDYDDYQSWLREYGGDWKRVDAEHWQAPSGLRIHMPATAPPEWLIGGWSCRGLDATGFNGGHPSPPIAFELRADGTGAIRRSGTDTAIQLWSYEERLYPGRFFPAIYVGIPRTGLEYAIDERTPDGIQLREAGFYREGRWNALSTQQRWTCVRQGRRA